MTKLFNKVTGTSTAFDNNSITDNSAEWKVDQFKDWWVVINGNEYLITSNTTDTLLFTNTLIANDTYSIEFVGRSYLTEIESDASNTVKIPGDLIEKKYNQANYDITNKIFAYLRILYKSDYDPLANIFNISIVQQSFAYYMLSRIYQDLMIDHESFEAFKGYNMYDKSYNNSIKDSLALLQVDLNADGVINPEEQKYSVSSYTFLTQ